jgi:hypothetical protein
MNRNMLLLLALAGCVGIAQAAQEQVYKWTDAGGVVHFSDAPPPRGTLGVQTVRVSGGDRPHAVPVENSESGSPNAAAANATSNPSTAADAAATRAKECATAHSNLDLLQGKMPVAVKNPDGSTQALDDKARAAQVASANAQIALYCD